MAGQGAAYFRSMISRDQKAKLRGLCNEKGFILEPAIPSGTFKLIHKGFGHAVKSPAGRTAFSARQAIVYLRSFSDAEP